MITTSTQVLCTTTTLLQVDVGGSETPTLRVRCGRCRHLAWSIESGEAAVRECLDRLRRDCPRKEANEYAVG